MLTGSQILFFDDPAPNAALAAKFSHYADKFPQWAEHHSGMLQYALWVAFEAEGMGCNLQHYNPVVVSSGYLLIVPLRLRVDADTR